MKTLGLSLCVRLVACACLVVLAACGGTGAPPLVNSVSATGSGAHSAQTNDASTTGYKVLYRFQGMPDGSLPLDGLVAVGNVLYGTTELGGAYGDGTVFSVDEFGNETIVYSFRGSVSSARDGVWPTGGLTWSKTRFYGTTSRGGQFDDGTVFTVDTSGNERVLHSFMGHRRGGDDGAHPQAPLIALNGKLYGTTESGGGMGCFNKGCGTVFSLTTTGKEVVLYRFKGEQDGANPQTSLFALNGKLYGTTPSLIYEVRLDGKERVLHQLEVGASPNALIAVDGVLYGTTENGGTFYEGTVFSLTTSGVLKTLHSFADGYRSKVDGIYPTTGLIYFNRNFYGTTAGGGMRADGTVFKMDKSGHDKVLHSFRGGYDGKAPFGPLYLLKGRLYGTTANGGNPRKRSGTVFRLKP